jgi:ABC-2 type transport system permease protein
MAFLSGAFGPTRSYPDVLQAIADLLPLTYLIDLLDRVYLGGGSMLDDPTAMLVVAAWGLAGYLVAWRRFRWMPRAR